MDFDLDFREKDYFVKFGGLKNDSLYLVRISFNDRNVIY